MAPFPEPRAPQPAKAKHDPRAFAEKVKLAAIGGTVAGFGVVWSLVAANAVGVTNRTSASNGATGTNGTGTNGTGTNGVTGTDALTGAGGGAGVSGAQGGASFFQGAGVQAPTFAGGTGSSGSGSVGSTASGSVGSTGSAGSSSHKLPTVSGFGSFGGPIVVSGSS